MNNFEPSKQTIGELFQKNTSLTIPRFQRSYEWKLVNIDDFYNDFIKVSDDHINFLGNIVIDRCNENERQIIDGQQRLVTVTILFAAIRDFLKEEVKSNEAKDLADDIDKSFIKHGTFAQTDNIYRLSPAVDLKGFFEAYIQMGGVQSRSSAVAKTQSAKNVSSAYKRFRQLLRDNIQTHQYDNLKKKIFEISNIQLIIIEIFDQDMAFAIFESFNAKRVDLSVADLVKNYYFSRLGKNAQLNEKTMDHWDEIVASLASVTEIDRFLHQYMQSYSGKFPKSHLYRQIRASIEMDHQKFINVFENNASILVSLKNADVGDIYNSGNISRINLMLNNIKMFNVEQCYILLLSVFRNSSAFTAKYLEKTVELIEDFTFVYSKVANEQANLLENIYARYASELEGILQNYTDSKITKSEDVSGRFYSKLRKELQDIMPQEEVFVGKFIDLDYSNANQRKLIRYIFTKTEEVRSKGGVALGYAANIDHIFPQNPPTGYKRPSQFNKIGNLVPIDSFTNSQVGNKLPKGKIEVYEKITNTQAVSLIKFMEYNGYEFDNDLISKRGREIATESYGVWSLKK